MASLNDKFFKQLDELKKEGKLRTIPAENSKRAFKAIKEETEPLNRDSKLKQAGSEKKARERFYNM